MCVRVRVLYVLFDLAQACCVRALFLRSWIVVIFFSKNSKDRCICMPRFVALGFILLRIIFDAIVKWTSLKGSL